MPRVKRGVGHAKRRKNILSRAKGYRWGRKSKLKLAKTAVTKAGAYSYRDRRNKKRVMRRLWQIKLNAAARKRSISFSKLIGILRKENILLDRKTLAHLAEQHPAVFDAVVASLKR